MRALLRTLHITYDGVLLLVAVASTGHLWVLASLGIKLKVINYKDAHISNTYNNSTYSYG